MAEPEYKSVNIEDIHLDTKNPRYEGLKSQLDTLQRIVEEQGPKLVRLARDVAEHGINPSKLLLVEANSDGGFTSLEGNRRVAVLKLLNQPELRPAAGLKESIGRRFKHFSELGQDRIPKALRCVVMSREEAEHWILLEHTGQNKGAGVVTWDGSATNRFRGGSPTLQAINTVGPHLDPDTLDELLTEGSTTFARLLNTPDARTELGVEITGQEFRLGADQDVALARLVAVAEEIARGTIDSRDLNRVDQRVAYAKEIAGRVTKPLSGTSSRKSGSSKSNKGDGTASRSTTQRVPLHRNVVIPKRCTLKVSPPRLNRIYDELQRIRLDRDYVNAGAVLLRVFVELSVEEYGTRHGISFKEKAVKGKPPKDLPLRKRVLLVADHLETAKTCNRTQLQGIRNVAAQKHHPLAIDTWHAYVHNPHVHPSPRILTETWDAIDPFMVGVWKK